MAYMAAALGTSHQLPSFPDWLEATMEAIIDKVMQTFSMMNALTEEQADNAKALADFFSENPQEDRAGTNFPPKRGA
jgi:hypothetical protein